jgi:aminoglycoside phosphotransferase (APT) family kinase protein
MENMETIPRYVCDIAARYNVVRIDLIKKGWSDDTKYFVLSKNRKNYQIRISDIKEYDRKKAEFDRIKKIIDVGVDASIPVEFGTCDDTKKLYMILTWMEGQDSEIVLPGLDKDMQYRLGKKAGRYLKKIHAIEANQQIESWRGRYKKKFRRKIKNYESCGIKIKDDKKIIDYILNNHEYLEGRPTVLQHGDYHVGNFVINKNIDLKIIDFNRSSYGDPWEEFNRIIFTWKISKEFAKGQIDGYFQNEVPVTFFKLMALYIATNIISSIPWAIPFGQKDVDVMIENSKIILESYNGFETFIPNWYK